MINYIRADLSRVSRRIPRLIALGLLLVIAIGFIIFTYTDTWNSVTFISSMELYLTIIPITIGIIEMSAVFGDDFRAKTMQIAIGIGITRVQVVLAKLLEVIILVVLDLLILLCVIMGLGAVLGAGVDMEQYIYFSGHLAGCALTIISYSSLCMILIFFMQGTGVSVVVYIAIASTLVKTIITSLAGLSDISNQIVPPLLLGTHLERLTAHLQVGNIQFTDLAVILAYIVVSVAITTVLFRKRELDF